MTPAPRPPGLYGLIRSDLQQKALWLYEDMSTKSIIKALLTDGTAAMIVYRHMQWARARRLWPLEFLFNKVNAAFNHCIIGRGAEFGPGLVLIHATGVVINGRVRGGARVHIEHQVTIGAEGRQSPSLGDDVFLGAGAKILGPIRIGDRVRVGANAVVIRDVPAGCTAVGVPARVIDRGGDGPPDPSGDRREEPGA